VPADAIDRWLDERAALLAVARDAARYAIDTGMAHAMDDHAAWPAMRRRGRRPNRATFLAFAMGHVYAEITRNLPSFSRDDDNDPSGYFVELCVAAIAAADIKGENAGEAAIRAHRLGRYSFDIHLIMIDLGLRLPRLSAADFPVRDRT
jgi:hypothetical protein